MLHIGVSILHIWLYRSHLERVRFADSGLIFIIHCTCEIPMIVSPSQSINHAAIAESRSLIHAALLCFALAPMHELVGGDRFGRAIVFLVAPRVAKDILDHFQFCQIVDLSADINPHVGHREIISCGWDESLERWCVLLRLPAIYHFATSSSIVGE